MGDALLTYLLTNLLNMYTTGLLATKVRVRKISTERFTEKILLRDSEN